MNGLVFHIVSGQSFFTGVVLICIAAMASTQSRALLKRVTVMCFLAGVIGVVVSSVVIPYWYLDTIHLSPAGHQRMARCVWSLVQSAYDADSP